VSTEAQNERMNVWERVDRELSRRRLDWPWLYKQLAVSKQTAHNWHKRGVPASRYQDIADALQVTMDWLVGNTDSRQGDSRRVVPAHDEPVYAGRPRSTAVRGVPVVGTARMGENGYYEEMAYPTGHGDGTVEGYSSDPNAYALRVKGDSMFPAIKDGQFVVIEPNGACVPGENVVLGLVDGRKMVKELLRVSVESITVTSVNGGDRLTLDKVQVSYMHPVSAVIAASKWKPA
jgi:phage repressor protein C with HTH and peptisase S24 domain